MDDTEINGGVETVKRLIFILFLSAVLAGCAGQQQKDVFIPVSGPIPEPPVITQPFLPIWLLTDEDDENPDKVVRYYVKALYLQRLHSDKLQCALDAYRIETEPQCPIKAEEE